MPVEMYAATLIVAILLAFVAGVVVGFLWCRRIIKRWIEEANLRIVKRGPSPS